MSETVEVPQSRVIVPALSLAQTVVVLSQIHVLHLVVEIAFVRWSRMPTVQVVQKTPEIPLVQCWDRVVGLLVVGPSRSTTCRVCSKR